MTDVNAVRLQKHYETENKRQNFELRKMRDQNNRVYQKEVEYNEDMLSKMREGYEVKVKNMENDLERKLVEIRGKHAELIQEENKRLDEELANIKQVHEDQVGEIKESNTNEITRMNESHRNSLDVARQKFMKEKNKWEA